MKEIISNLLKVVFMRSKKQNVFLLDVEKIMFFIFFITLVAIILKIYVTNLTLFFKELSCKKVRPYETVFKYKMIIIKPL